MAAVIIVFGVLTLLAGIAILINPEVIFGFLRNHVDKLGLHILAVAGRVVLGILLIVQSGVSKFPVAMEIIGWLAIAAAVGLGVMGRHNFKRLMSWALSLKRFSRVGGVIAAAFGAFIVYAFV